MGTDLKINIDAAAGKQILFSPKGESEADARAKVADATERTAKWLAAYAEGMTEEVRKYILGALVSGRAHFGALETERAVETRIALAARPPYAYHPPIVLYSYDTAGTAVTPLHTPNGEGHDSVSPNETLATYIIRWESGSPVIHTEAWVKTYPIQTTHGGVKAVTNALNTLVDEGVLSRADADRHIENATRDTETTT